MRKFLSYCFAVGSTLVCSNVLLAQGVGINTTNANPDASAMLDVVATNKGVLIPRVALTATNAAAPVTTPLTSLLVYNTATAGAGLTAVSPGFYYWDGAQWVRFQATNSPTSITPAALTKVDDTNVTLTLGGTPGTALLQNVSVTAGWTGQLGVARGGTNGTAVPTAGAIAYGTGTAYGFTGVGTAGQVLTSNGAGVPTWTTVANNNWTLTGNAGTNSATNFVGTTDAVDFVARTNNVERLRILSGSGIQVTSTNFNANALNPAVEIQGAWIRMGDALGNQTFTNGMGIKFHDSGVQHASIQFNPSTSFFNFGTSGGNGNALLLDLPASPTVAMDLNNRRLGIGTNAPAEALHAIGNVRSSTLAGVGTRLAASDVNGTLVNIAAGTNGQVLTMVAGTPAWATAANTNWTLTGNAGTTPGTNFVGTSDAQDFVTRTNNTERMRVTSAGNVGIGTTTPIANLHVQATPLANTSVLIGDGITGLSTSVANLQIGVNGQTSALVMGSSNTTYGVLSWRSDAPQRFSLYTGNSTASPLILQEFGGGNVAIGSNTAPAERLHVMGNIRSSNLAGAGTRLAASDLNGTLVNIAAGSNGQVLTMVAGTPAWAANTAWGLTGNAGTNAATNFVGTTDAVDFVTRTSNAERMRVTSAGNVGIGVAAPGTNARLHVAGGAIRPEAGNVAAAGIHWGADIFGGGGDEPYLRYYSEGGEDTKLVIANQNDASDDIMMEAGYITFRTGDGGTTVADADRMIITTAGNVGIGTNTPTTAKLVVAGASGGQGLDLSSTDQYTNVRVLQNTNSTIDKDMYLGYNSGATSSLHLYSNNTEAMRISAAGTTQLMDVFGAGGRNLIIGDDSYFSDMDAAHRVGLISTSNANIGELMLGSSGTNPVLSGNPGYLGISQELQVQITGNRFRRATAGIMWTDQFDTGTSGVHIGNNESEEGGFWANGNYAMIYNPGDNDLLKIVDEDYLDNVGSMYDANAMRARVDGNGQYFQISDAKSKDKITPIANGLAKVTSLNGYTYEFKLLESEIAKGQKPSMAAGILAQEVETVLPEAVSKHEGNYMVNYAAFVPLFIEAIKEQNVQVQQLQKENAALKSQLDEVKALREEMQAMKKLLEENKKH